MRHMMVWVLLPLIAGIAQADTTWVAGNVSGTWTAEGNPYIPMSNVSIPHGSSLRIEAGVRVEFHGSLSMGVMGTLHCEGTAQNPILFTQDTVQYPARWYGLHVFMADSEAVIRHTILEYCLQYDGTVFAAGSTVTLEDVVIRDCLAGVSANGGVLTLCNVGIFRCGYVGCGGGLRADNGSQITADYLSLQGCSALDGGGMCIRESRGTFTNSRFTLNNGHIWGGVMFAEDSPLTFSNCTFLEDSCLLGAGGYIVGDSSVTYDHCVFARNVAQYTNNGGNYSALYAPGLGRKTIDNCLFYGNVSQQGNLLWVGGQGVIIECASIDNLGAAVVLSGPYQYFYSDFQPRISLNGWQQPGSGVLTQVNSNGDSTDAYGNLFVPAGFVDATQNDFRLLESSHLIDAGNPSGPMDPDCTVADIGPYYFSQPIVVADLTIRRPGNTSDVVLRWSRPHPSLSYRIYRTDVFPWDNERQVYLGMTADTTWFDLSIVTQASSAYYQVAPFFPED